MDFRQRLIETLRAIQPILDLPGVIVVGSEVPNLLQHPSHPTLVISQDVDIGISVGAHRQVWERLRIIEGLAPSPSEPSVWLPCDPNLIEVNFLGIDAALRRIEDTYVLEDANLPLLVFGPLSLISAAAPTQIDGVRMTLPRPAGLLLEKLVTDRTGEKGDRDLLVALGLLLVMDEASIAEAITGFAALSKDQRSAVRSNLTVLSLLPTRAGMPDPAPHRRMISAILSKMDAIKETQE
jgi:hypothetical protein